MYGVVSGTQRGWTIAARKGTSTVASHQRAADAERDGALGTADVQRLTFAAEHRRDRCAVAAEAAGGGDAEALAVVQHCGTDPGTQRIPVDGHRDVRGFARGGGEIVGSPSSSLASSLCSWAAVRGFEKSSLRDTRHWTSPSGAKG